MGRAAPFPFSVSTPEAEGLDAGQLALAFDKASRIPQIYSMLVLRNGHLVAEEYFAQPDRHTAMPVASVGKSILSVLTGIALDNGHLENLDQTMIGFFPEYDQPLLDPRKRTITIRHLLTMRSGYPFDSTTHFFNLISASTNWMQFIIVGWNLEFAPDTDWNYSNAAAHLVSGILTRATGNSLQTYANTRLFGPMGQRIDDWPRDPQGYCVGPGDVHCTPVELACLGQLMLDGGLWRGRRIVAEEWVDSSLEPLSATTYGSTIWPYRDIRYGYLWWHAAVDDVEVHFAWGHGGQFIFVVPELEMVVVTTAYNFIGDFTNTSWATEGAIFRLIATDVIPSAR